MTKHKNSLITTIKKKDENAEAKKETWNIDPIGSTCKCRSLRGESVNDEINNRRHFL